MGFGVYNSQNCDFVRDDKMGEDSRLVLQAWNSRPTTPAMSKMRPFCLCSETRHLISAARNKKTWNPTNYFIRVHTKALFRRTFYYWQYNILHFADQYVSRATWLLCL